MVSNSKQRLIIRTDRDGEAKTMEYHQVGIESNKILLICSSTRKTNFRILVQLHGSFPGDLCLSYTISEVGVGVCVGFEVKLECG